MHALTSNPLYLVLLLFAAIALLILLINWRTKLHPALALLTVSLLTALAAGENLSSIPKTLTSGAGGVLGNTGLVVALGAMIGRLLADSGAVRKVADLVLDHSSERTAPWVMTGIAFVIGIPMFFEVGLVVLLPIIYAAAVELERRAGQPRLWYVKMLLPAVAALSCLHGMVPPHPGPLIAVEGLHANTGLTIGLGLLCAIPTVIIAGPLYAQWIAPRVALQPNAELVQQYAGESPDAGSPGKEAAGEHQHGVPAEDARRGTRSVPTWLAFVSILVPVFLMLLRVVAELAAPGTAFETAAVFLGTPLVAMLLGALFAALALGITAGMSGQQVRDTYGGALKSIVGVILIIGAGGAFNGVLKDSGIGDAVVAETSHLHMNLIVLGWFVGLLLSFCTGSATVGIVSATGIVAPLVGGSSEMHVALIAIAIGCGSIGLNWVNHAGFWFVKEAFGMTLGQATKTHMVVQTIVSVVGLLCALGLSLLA